MSPPSQPEAELAISHYRFRVFNHWWRLRTKKRAKRRRSADQRSGSQKISAGGIIFSRKPAKARSIHRPEEKRSNEPARKSHQARASGVRRWWRSAGGSGKINNDQGVGGAPALAHPRRHSRNRQIDHLFSPGRRRRRRRTRNQRSSFQSRLPGEFSRTKVSVGERFFNSAARPSDKSFRSAAD